MSDQATTPTPTIEARRAQVLAQYRAVAHLACGIMECHGRDGEAAHVRAGRMDGVLGPLGRRSHRIIEDLADILQGMDLLLEVDEWVDPVLEAAREMFPIEGGE